MRIKHITSKYVARFLATSEVCSAGDRKRHSRNFHAVDEFRRSRIIKRKAAFTVMSFLASNKELRQLRPKVLAFYRLCLKVIRDLPKQQKVYYDYTRLKFKENADLTDAKKIRSLINTGEEELQWVRKILDYREDGNSK